jgi:uncharacterized protein (DUF1778 family)
LDHCLFVNILDLYGNNPYILHMENAMTQHLAQSSRMDLRLPQEVRDLIDHAAAMEGRTRSDFVIAAALERAEQLIERRRIIRLTLQDQELLAKSLMDEHEREVPQYAKDIAGGYAVKVVSE